jgi:hypothetical protein
VEYAYQHVRADLLAQAPALARVLRRHGLVLNTDVLRDSRRTFRSAAAERRELARRATERLGDTLEQLEGVLEEWRS